MGPALIVKSFPLAWHRIWVQTPVLSEDIIFERLVFQIVTHEHGQVTSLHFCYIGRLQLEVRYGILEQVVEIHLLRLSLSKVVMSILSYNFWS